MLPYSTRHLSFSGVGTTVQGDIRTVGMGGATVGLADTFIAAIDNPAGLAMTVGVGDVHYATNTIHDENIQRFDNAPETQSIGLALGIYPWALSVGYLSRYREDSTYQLPYLVPKPVELSVITRELVLSAARVFWHNRIAVGVGVILGQAERALEVPALKIDRSFASYTAGASLGVTAQLPRRFLLGLTFASPQHYSAASPSQQQSLPVPGFFQSVELPWRVSAGLGFIPSRFFRADFTLHLFTATPHTALVRDEQAVFGLRVTLKPRLGLGYVFAEFRQFKATFFAGTYYESTRIAGTSNRFHGTFGAEARIWVITFGAGLDFADRYRNYLFSAGVDVFGLMARLHMIPEFWTPPSERIMPPAMNWSDEGLARPLQAHWKPSPRDVDPIKVGLDIPRNLEKGIRNAGLELKHFEEQIAAGIESTNDTPEVRRERAQKAAEAEQREAARRASEERQRAEAQEAAQRAEDDARQAQQIERVIEEKGKNSLKAKKHHKNN